MKQAGPCSKINRRPGGNSPQALGGKSLVRNSFDLESRQRFLPRFLAAFFAGFFLAAFLGAALAFFFAFLAAGFFPFLAGAFFLAAGFGAAREDCGAPATPGAR